jgi:quercetin dioxygenase-like cupin family protein
MKRILLIAVVVVTAATTAAGMALATAPSGLSATELGRINLGPYHLTSPSFKIFSKDTTDTVVLRQTFAPGGSTGWHTHPGPAYIVVTQGTVTLYDGDDPTCTPHTYGAGTGFLDPGFGHVHIARNEGTTPVTVIATYLNVPPGGSPRIDADDPGNCSF